ncbi:type VI secretion system protein TssA [Pseudacidovorax intermedius]|nr:type VI secretion system protein TssA [Pseudacidovorax intermedius]
MLTPDIVDALLEPIGEASPCGDDLEYDPDFIALETSAQGKPEQQFGDTIIPAVEPEWPQVAEAAQALLRRTKDVRVAMHLLRASTRLQGLEGFLAGMRLLAGLLDSQWDHIHPMLDADDDNDPTMRLNALAPLADDALVVRDVYDAWVGTARSVGRIRVRDIAIGRGLLEPASGDAGYSAPQVQGGLEEIVQSQPEVAERLAGIAPAVNGLRQVLNDRSGLGEAVDMSRLRAVGHMLAQTAQNLAPDAAEAAEGDAAAGEAHPGAEAGEGGGRGTAPAPIRGEIQSRADALLMLDKVIAYLQRTEPGNPAPLLIERAKKLIGVSFLDIIANLAPDAMSTIEHVTGARAPSDDD